MTRGEMLGLVSELSDCQKIKVLRLLTLVAAHPRPAEVLAECRARGLDLDATIARLQERVSADGEG